MTKHARVSLIAGAKAAAQEAEKLPPQAATMTEDYTSSTIHLPKALLRKLRDAANARADRIGGRPSVSAVVVDILLRHADEIDAEISKD